MKFCQYCIPRFHAWVLMHCNGRTQNKSFGKVKVKVCLLETKTSMEVDFSVEEELLNLHKMCLSFWYRNMRHLKSNANGGSGAVAATNGARSLIFLYFR